MELKDWIDSNYLDVQIIEKDLLFLIEGVGKFLVISPKVELETNEEVLFDPEFNIILDDLEEALVSNVDYICFCFGNQWYYSKYPEINLKILKYLGNAKEA